jgi:CRISPR-associated protein Csm3
MTAVQGQLESISMAGRLVLQAEIHAVTGLHIGAGRGALQIGGVDNPIVRDPLTRRPYIPGSSLKGKLRSLLERRNGLPLNQPIGQSRIHICKAPEAFENCPVCPIFGIPGEQKHAQPTRLLVRDVLLSKESAAQMERMDLDTPYGEVKWEVAIDRITSAANPRQLERVPAGAVFSPAELIYGFYDPPQADIERFRQLIEAMQLLENDYLGGHGSRGSGKIAFRGIRLTLRTTKDYERELTFSAEGWDDLPGFVSQIDELLEWLRQQMPE